MLAWKRCHSCMRRAGGCVVGQHGGEQLPQLVVLLLHGLLVVLLMLL
jgi:hypothetical protein